MKLDSHLDGLEYDKDKMKNIPSHIILWTALEAEAHEYFASANMKWEYGVQLYPDFETLMNWDAILAHVLEKNIFAMKS